MKSLGILALAALFIAGAFAGAAADHWLTRREAATAIRAPTVDPGQFRIMRDSVVRARQTSDLTRLRDTTGIPDQFLQLGLTPDEVRRLTEIARRRRPRSDSVNAIIKSLKPMVTHMETEMMQEMLCALTPAQQAQWLANMRVGWDPKVVAERYELVRTHTCGGG